MLSRHFLRCKVLQELYAAQVDELDAISTMRDFDYNIAKLSELGVLQVGVMVKMLDVAAKVMAEGKKKFRPSDEEKKPNLKFTHNQFLVQLADNFELKQHLSQWGSCWDTHEDVVREVFLELRHTKLYGDYLSTPEGNYDEDKDFAINLFRYLMNRDILVTTLSERSLLWEDDFDQIAQYNFMMLKTLTQDNFNEASHWPIMYDTKRDKSEMDVDFARQLLRASIELRQESDELVRQRLHGWEFERVALMDILLINMAVAELTTCPSIPEKVTVDEYVELSKEFSTDRSKLFINGLLDKLVLVLRSKGRIQKSGRGLLNEFGEEA